MSRRTRLVLCALSLALLVIFGYFLKGFLEIDSCLDRGGRWNYETGTCEYHENKENI
jgi:hypothetical protein